jgi:hypothetical protein
MGWRVFVCDEAGAIRQIGGYRRIGDDAEEADACSRII